jgi:hypothetical protein
MNDLLDLTKANRLVLAQAFRENPKVDYLIECVVEGQMGRAYVDSLEEPRAFRIEVGPFWYFAGEAHAPEARGMIECMPAYTILMPSPPAWMELANQVFGSWLLPLTRYSFSTVSLSEAYLQRLLAENEN